MVASFRHFMAVSAGTVIALGYGIPAVSQNVSTLAESEATTADKGTSVTFSTRDPETANESVIPSFAVNAENPTLMSIPSVEFHGMEENIQSALTPEPLQIETVEILNEPILAQAEIEIDPNIENPPPTVVPTLENFPDPVNDEGEEDAGVLMPSPLIAPDLDNVPIPDRLNPSSNPLLFPTQPDEVDIEVVEPITLEQAIALARRNNEEFRVAFLNLERARAALREALAAEFPTINTQVDFTRVDSANRELSVRGTGFDDTTSTSLDASLQLSYNLYTGGRRSAQIKAARRQVTFNQLDVERIAEELRFNTIEAYYNLQQADAEVGIAEAAVEEAQQSLRDAQLLEEAGLGTRFDVLRAEV
ncbi:MAG: TolC family protein, partial [Chroococcales cyanobacterium]